MEQWKKALIVYIVAFVFTVVFGFNIILKKTNKGGIINFDCYVITNIMTFWQVLHFLTRVVLGFLAPDLIWYFVGIDTAWEVAETTWGDHNWGDLIYNNLGLACGYLLSKKYNKNPGKKI